MIGYLRGELIENREGHIIIDVGGVGYVVLVSERTREELPAIGGEVRIYTHMSVREDDVSLFGFLRKDEQEMFNKLIQVSGVGPKGALNILSTFDVANLKYAIVSGDAGKIAKAPTIGKKTAEKIIIDLKDKINKDEILEYSAEETVSADPKLSDDARDAIDALVALGYDRKRSEKAVASIEGHNEMDTSAILKEAFPLLL